jgi:hypothetical protein
MTWMNSEKRITSTRGGCAPQSKRAQHAVAMLAGGNPFVSIGIHLSRLSFSEGGFVVKFSLYS